ncbi:MAG TPA: hypothetical protein VLG44_03775 [Chlamydiales bacterium]|nr:hypothetical protein [Chlamydiales bacterium]
MANLSISLSRLSIQKPYKNHADRTHAKITLYENTSKIRKSKLYSLPVGVPKEVYYLPIVTARNRVVVLSDKPEPAGRVQRVVVPSLKLKNIPLEPKAPSCKTPIDCYAFRLSLLKR